MSQLENVNVSQAQNKQYTYFKHFITFSRQVAAHSTRVTDNCQDFEATEHDVELADK